MYIKKWFGGALKDQKYTATDLDLKSQEKEKSEITFESDKELLERSLSVRIGSDLIGYIIKKNGIWGWMQVKEASSCFGIEILDTETMIAITEKLKELNGVSDVQIEIKRLEQRLLQLEMMNSVYLTSQQVKEIVDEVENTRAKLKVLRALK